MSGIVAIHYTQDQARTLTGVSVETLRHWRKAVPYLSLKAGKAARFSFTDLLGLTVTNELVNTFGAHIAVVSEGVDALFRLLAANGPASLDSAVVLVTANDAMLLEMGGDGVIGLVPGKPALLIALTPLIAKIQQHVLPVMSISNQTMLPFPPEAVRSRVS